MMRSAGFEICGVEWSAPPNVKGITAYNNHGTKLTKGDIVLLNTSGTAGQEVKADFPATLDITAVVLKHTGVVWDDFIEAGKIGRIALQGDVQAMVDGTTDIAIGDSLEVLNGVAFDGTITNTAITLGTGTTKDTMTDSDSGLVTDGFLAGARISNLGFTSTANNQTFTLSAVAAGTLTYTTIGATVAEAGVAGGTIKQFGWLTKDSTSQTVKTLGFAKEARSANSVGLIKIYKTGHYHTIAAS